MSNRVNRVAAFAAMVLTVLLLCVPSWSDVTLNVHWCPDIRPGSNADVQHGGHSGNIWLNMVMPADTDPNTMESLTYVSGTYKEDLPGATEYPLPWSGLVTGATCPSCAGSNQIVCSMDPSLIFQPNHNVGYVFTVTCRYTKMTMFPPGSTSYNVTGTATVTRDNVLLRSVPDFLLLWNPEANPAGMTFRTSWTDAQKNLAAVKYEAKNGFSQQFGSIDSPGSHSYYWDGKVAGITLSKGIYPLTISVATNPVTFSGDSNRSGYLTTVCGQSYSSQDAGNYNLLFSYTLTDSGNKAATSGEVWLFGPDLDQLGTWTVTDLTASTGGTAHQMTLPIPKSCFQKGGTYYLVLHVLDGHAMDYKDHKSKYAVESIASWQPKIWRPIPSPISLALTVPNPVLPNRTYTLTAAASDYDYWVQGTTTGSTADGISLYAWTASCGTFPSGTSTASVQWTSPAVIPPEGAHFSCTVDDTGTIGGSDLGSRDDAPVTTTEAALPPIWWDPYDPPEPIKGALIQGPQANSIWLCNSEVACSISDATDIDRRTDQFGAVTYPNDTFNNSDAYVWSATAGTFKDTDSDGQPNTRGKNVVWIAPATSCNATIKCRVKDDAIVPNGELGSRDD